MVRSSSDMKNLLLYSSSSANIAVTVYSPSAFIFTSLISRLSRISAASSPYSVYPVTKPKKLYQYSTVSFQQPSSPTASITPLLIS